MLITDHPSPNHGPRPFGAVIDILLVHYTGMPSAAAALARLCDPTAEVSAHYLIDEDGRILRLVPEERRAWHAGRSFWAGVTDINSRSIGIELVNPGHAYGYRAFPPAQMAAFIDLAQGILARHPIPPTRVLAHADVAPARKQDPGELFDWAGLAGKGIGAVPSPRLGLSATPDEPARLLCLVGYDPDAPLTQVIAAYQRHFRPHTITGVMDAETLALLRGHAQGSAAA